MHPPRYADRNNFDLHPTLLLGRLKKPQTKYTAHEATSYNFAEFRRHSWSIFYFKYRIYKFDFRIGWLFREFRQFVTLRNLKFGDFFFLFCLFGMKFFVTRL